MQSKSVSYPPFHCPADPEKIPYTIMGPYLTPLFERAFIDGLHDATKRPTADEWESARLKQSI